jgi:hypothetical protein
MVCFGIGLVALGVVAVAVATRGLSEAWRTVAVAAAVAVVAGLSGLAVLMYEEYWTFTAHEISRRWRTLFGRKEWSEPISAYAGVLMRSVYHSGSKNSPSYTEYIVELKHSGDNKKTVQLYNSRSPDGFRAQQERYARLFAVSALVETEHGIEERSVEDLDKTIRDRVLEGSMDVQFDASKPPPGTNLSVRVEGDGLLISARRGLLGKAGKIIPIVTAILGSGLVIGGIARGKPPEVVMLPIMGAFFLVMGLGVGFAGRLLRQELIVSAAGVRTRWIHPWGAFAEVSLPADEIEDVALRTPPGSHGFTSVVIATDAQTAWFGVGLEPAEKEWVRDCIIAVISR